MLVYAGVAQDLCRRSANLLRQTHSSRSAAFNSLLIEERSEVLGK